MLLDYARVLDDIFGQFEGQKFSVKLWDGHTVTYGKGRSSAFTLEFKDKHTLKRILAQGSLGFGEAYMEGRLVITGDLSAYLRMRYQFRHEKSSPRLALATLYSMATISRNTKRQISHHYDLGNDFFQLFLDKSTMSYSAGRYKKDSDTLAQAQKNKLNLIGDWLALPKNATVLDLGSGWGGFAVHAAKNYGWNVTGYTLSKAQLAYCRELAIDNKLENQLSFVYKDMLKELPKKPYDAVVMIESLEHVNKKQLSQFFQDIRHAVKPGGSLYIQNTGRHKSHRPDRLTVKYVFPGGYLPSLGEVVNAAGEAGFALEIYRDDTPDYIRTLTEWVDGIEHHRADIEDMFGADFYRLWELWTKGARAGFETQTISLFRLHFRRLK